MIKPLIDVWLWDFLSGRRKQPNWMISYAYNQKWWLDTGSSLTQFRISSDWAQWSGMLSWAHTDFTKLFLRAEANIFSTNVQLHFYLKSFQTYEIQLCINFVFVTLLLEPCPFSFFRGLNGLKLYLFVDMPARLQEEIVRSSISLVAKKKKLNLRDIPFTIVVHSQWKRWGNLSQEEKHSPDIGCAH